MKRLLIAASLVLTLATSALAASPPFPWRTYSDVPITSGGSPACANGGVLYQVAGGEWRVLSWRDRDLFIHFGPDGEPDYAYLTIGNIEDGVIKVRRVLPAAEARVLFPTGCEYGDSRDL